MKKQNNIILTNKQYDDICQAFTQQGISIELKKFFIECWISKILSYCGGILDKELIRQAKRRNIEGFKNGEYKSRPITVLINYFYYSGGRRFSDNIYEHDNICMTGIALVEYGRHKKKFNKAINEILVPYVYYKAKSLVKQDK